MYLDCKKKPCPQPVVLSLKALKELSAGDVLEVEVDNQAAVENLKRMATEKKCTVTVTEKDGAFLLTLTPEGTAAESGIPAEQEAKSYCSPESLAQPAGPFVVAVGTNEMGQGDPQLGKVLIKGYLYALAQLPDELLPKVMLFFNGGAKLTIEDSESLADIKALAERGVEIRTCGTCLDFYGIKEKLAVGIVTNMYDICETMAKAGKCVRI